MGLERLDGGVWRSKALGVALDRSRAPELDDDPAPWKAALGAMRALEAGAVANPDEGRQVGHYWLRAPELAPEGYQAAIREAVDACKRIALEIRRERRYRTLLLLGVGGSALGPEFLGSALREPEDPLRLVVLDNTDPDGLARVIGPLDLEEVLVVCTSKSGGTPETRNALIEVQAAFARAEVPFAPNAIAVSQEGSALWQAAEGWRARLPMWEWVGGRTSVCSAVGLLPLVIQGADIDGLLAGAAAMDAATRSDDLDQNPALLLARCWFVLGHGHGDRAMVVLPYRDRLQLLARYLQQLVMESIGKERDLQGRAVHQRLTVYGNKGSTDQHAFVQQLREGPDDHFTTLIGVREDGYYGEEVEPGIDAGDYLHGFLLGTRAALSGAHPVLTIWLQDVSASRLGALVALFERAVGLYAARIGVNAYHQPGVEAGKKAAASVLRLKGPLLEALSGSPQTAEELAAAIGAAAQVEDCWHLLWRAAANGQAAAEEGDRPSADRFWRA